MSEIIQARGDEQDLVHLRLSVSALELAMVPFELAIAPEGFPGSGSPLFLQSRTPLTITREVRRGQMLPVKWDRKPRILFAFAQPAGFAPVPAAEHLGALRRAIEPWVKWSPTEQGRVAEVKKVLTVLPNATIESIRDACRAAEYTHIHILAHGAELGRGEQRFGLALCTSGDPAASNIVDGETLAIAVTDVDRSQAKRQPPTLVSLATCDSGQVGSVITTGGSIAHELNGAGIPWVVASQFPLWMRASTIAVDVLYRGLLRGEDPRSLLYQLRKRLRTDSAATHDWASIVAYASVPWDFSQQLRAFRNLYTRTAVEVEFDHAEQLVAAGGSGLPEVEAIYDSIRQRLEIWCAEATSDGERCERLGMRAATEKRIGTLRAPDAAQADYRTACDLYRQALALSPVNHWAITQHLSLRAVLARPDEHAKLASTLGNDWQAARQIATWALREARGEKEAWALGSLAELELLASVFAGGAFDRQRSQEEIGRLCRRICDTVTDDAFPVFSTRRQFERYLKFWRQDTWTDLAQIACDLLPDKGSWVGRPYVPPVQP
jgi:hypothetical protein